MSEIENEKYITTKYRFVVLGIFMLMGIMTQIMWITFAPISKDIESFYGISENMVVWALTGSFMIAYIPVNFPACWLIDKFGLKWGVGIGVMITGIFGLIRGIFANNFIIVLISQIMCAIGQPFVLNAFTKLAANWFPEKEKATASGLGTISMFFGIIIGMMLPEILNIGNNPKIIPNLLLGYGIAGVLGMILYLVFIKDKPENPPNAYADKTKVLVTTGLKDMFKIKDFNYLLLILFFCLGSFNAITTVIDYLFDPTLDSGIISGMMIIGGVLGAIILSTISDAKHKRKIFLILALVITTPLNIALALVSNATILYIVSLVYGFFLVSALPIGLTYGAEITYPAPEESSNGLLMMLGQIGGIILIAVPPAYLLYVVTGLFTISAILTFLIKDTPWYEEQRKKHSETQ
ncbi:MAG: MFS transporter [Promethearchaeota archaeon]